MLSRVKTIAAVRIRALQQYLERDSVSAPAYRAWRKQFMQQRLRLGLQIAIAAYVTFILLRLGLTATHMLEGDASWFIMACSAEFGLLLCLTALDAKTPHPRVELIFLGSSWSITLTEQIWASLNGIAFPGLYAWTLVFLAQAALVPVRWYLHLASQMGLLLYYFGVNTLLGFAPEEQPLWDAVQVLYLFWFCVICDLSVFLYERLQKREFRTRRELEAEKEKSENLLLNILPEAIAQQLKQKHDTIAESFSEVTVLFADIVGFTQLSAGIPADELVRLLNQIFSTFDQLAEQHQLEKIKTIGDAYMVVGGLPTERDDHVEAIANMAIDMQRAITQFRTRQNQPFRIRIGINTGPVVAGVIGTKKFIYDLWGDTVNIASRMESQGIPGQIQVTAAVYERLRHTYRFEDRGVMEVKGRGEMRVYLLQEKLETPSLDMVHIA